MTFIVVIARIERHGLVTSICVLPSEWSSPQAEAKGCRHSEPDQGESRQYKDQELGPACRCNQSTKARKWLKRALK